MIKAVIFDLDDTLISEYDYIKSGYRVISKKIKEDYKLENSEEQIYSLMWELFENDSKKVFNRLLEKLKLNYNEEYIKELVKTYREHIPQIEFFEDVIHCIKQLRKQDIKLGIITDGYAVTQNNKLKVLNAYELFDKIIITDELGKEYWKPNPKSFEIMKDYFNVEYDEMMYVGDNPRKDFYIKKYHPIKIVRIYRENSVYNDEEYYEGIEEDYRIRNLEELLKNGELN